MLLSQAVHLFSVDDLFMCSFFSFLSFGFLSFFVIFVLLYVSSHSFIHQSIVHSLDHSLNQSFIQTISDSVCLVTGL